MRHYTSDSAEAMARVVSLALLADGGLDNSELKTLEQHAILDQLSISADTFDRVLHEFCDDVLISARAPNVGQIEIDCETINGLLADICAPELQKQALRAILDIVGADRCLNGGEAILVSQAMSRWHLELHEVERADRRQTIRDRVQIERRCGTADEWTGFAPDFHHRAGATTGVSVGRLAQGSCP